MSDLIQGAAQLINQGLGIWGASQNARRQADYQQALSMTRDQMGRLFSTIQRSPTDSAQDIYLNGAAAETGIGVVPGITDIKSEVTEAWLTDPYVRQQYDQAWISLEQNLRESVRTNTEHREMLVLDIQGEKQAMDTWNIGDYQAAYASFQAIKQGNIDSGIWTPQRGDQVEGQWRTAGVARLNTDLEAAVKARDRDAVEGYIQASLQIGLIVDPDAAVKIRGDLFHRIYVGETTDLVMAMDPAEGIPWIMDSKNAPELTLDERTQLLDDLENKRDRVRSEDRWQRDEADRVMNEKMNDEVESEAVAGNISWGQALATLQQPEVKSALTRSSLEHLRDRWTHMMEEEEILSDPPAEGLRYAESIYGDQKYLDIIERMINDPTYDVGPVEADIARYSRPDEFGVILLRPSQVGDLRKNNQNRELLHGPASDVISDIMKEYTDLSPGAQSTMRATLYSYLPTLQVHPDGTPRTGQELINEVRTAATNIAEPKALQAIGDAATRIEGLTGKNMFGQVIDWFGGNARTWTAEEKALQQLQEAKVMVGTVALGAFDRVLSSGLRDPDAIQSLVLEGRIYDNLDENEQTIVDNNVKAIMLAGNHALAYEEFTGIKPVYSTTDNFANTPVNAMGRLSDGTIAFHSPQHKVVQLRTVEEEKDERWFEFRNGAWVISDDMNTMVPVRPADEQEAAAEAAPGVMSGDVPLYDAPREYNAQVSTPEEVAARQASRDSAVAAIMSGTTEEPAEEPTVELNEAEEIYLSKVETALDSDIDDAQRRFLEKIKTSLNSGAMLTKTERDGLAEILLLLGIPMFTETR